MIILRKKISSFLFCKEKRKAKKIYDLLKREDPSKSINKFHETLLAGIIQNASRKVLYYKNIRSEQLIDWPVVDKEIIRKRPKDFIDNDYPSYNKIRFNTGGSTGEPFEFLTTRLSGYIDQIHQIFFHEKIGYQKGDKLFSFGGLSISDRMKKRKIYWERTEYTDATYGSYNYSSLYLNEDEIFIKILQDLCKKQPSFLRGYPSTLAEIAQYIDKTDFPLNLKLKGIVLTAENIMPWQMDLISRVFHAPVYGQYGHSEKCIFAYTEANSLSYRCSPYYGYVEVLNDDNLHVEEGESGRVVVTSYYNKAMYFIRYDTGDIAEYGGKDHNGWVILNSITGRKQDFIFDKNKKKIIVTALVFGQHLHAFNHIKKWQIEQNNPGEVRLKIIKGENYSLQDENEIREKLFAQWDIKAQFLYVESIPLTTRGKFRFVLSKIEE
jgi:phenylacetate-CoA ligase